LAQAVAPPREGAAKVERKNQRVQCQRCKAVRCALDGVSRSVFLEI